MHRCLYLCCKIDNISYEIQREVTLNVSILIYLDYYLLVRKYIVDITVKDSKSKYDVLKVLTFKKHFFFNKFYITCSTVKI